MIMVGFTHTLVALDRGFYLINLMLIRSDVLLVVGLFHPKPSIRQYIFYGQDNF